MSRTPDPFESLAVPAERQEPRPSYARQLRARLVDELGIEENSPPTVQLPERKRAMTTTQTSTSKTSTSKTGRNDGNIWAAVHYADALAGIRFMTEVLGFEEQLVVTHPDDETNVVHSQIRWPEGGIVQAGTAALGDDHDVFRREPGSQSLYVITDDPQAVWDRCRAAGVEVVREPESPDYDPSGIGFSVRDPEGNIWSFGTYAGEA